MIGTESDIGIINVGEPTIDDSPSDTTEYLDPTVTPSNKEGDAPPEEPLEEVRTREIQTLYDVSINQLCGQIEEEIKGKTEPEKKVFFDQNPAKRKIYQLRWIKSLPATTKPGDDRQPKANGDGNISTTKPIPWQHNGQEFVIDHFWGTRNNNCIVRLRGDSGELRTTGIPREKFLELVAMADREPILSACSEEIRKVLEIRMNMWEQKAEFIPSLTTEETKTTLLTTADSINYPTTNDLKQLIDSRKLNPDITDEEKARLNSLERLINQNVLLNYDTFIETLNLLGVSRESAALQVPQLQKEVSAYEESLKLGLGDPGKLAKDLRSAKLKLLEQEQILKIFESDAVEDCFAKISSGEMKPEESRSLREAIRTGDIDHLIRSLLPDDPNNQKEVENQRADLKAIMEQGAGITLLLVLLAVSEGITATNKAMAT